jgi:hypothetical protein
MTDAPNAGIPHDEQPDEEVDDQGEAREGSPTVVGSEGERRDEVAERPSSG